MHLFLFSPANRPAGTLVCMNFKRHETDEYYDIVALRHTMQAVQGLGGGVHMQTHFASERAHVQQLQAHRSHRCHQNSGVQQCCSPLTYTSARLIVVSAWNHFIITDVTRSPTSLRSVLSDVPPLSSGPGPRGAHQTGTMGRVGRVLGCRHQSRSSCLYSLQSPLLGYMPQLMPDLMKHTFFFARSIKGCMTRTIPPLFN